MSPQLPENAPGISSRSTVMVVVAATVLIVIGPLIGRGLSGERARWCAAEAYEKYLTHDQTSAFSIIQTGLARWPESRELLQMRLQLHMEMENHAEALADCNRLIFLNPEEAINLLEFRITIYQHLRRHAEALADVKRVVEKLETTVSQLPDPGALDGLFSDTIQEQRASLLASAYNLRAYSVAVAHWHAKLDGAKWHDSESLRLALADAERALELQPLAHPASILDTRGFIHYLMGNLAEAQVDLEAAIQIDCEFAHRLEQQVRASFADRREAALELNRRAKSMAIVHFHRALVLHDRGLLEILPIDAHRF